jgi:hypothetical protein
MTRMIRRLIVLGVVLAGACKGHATKSEPAVEPATGSAAATTPPPSTSPPSTPPDPATGSASEPASACAAQTAELRTFLGAVFDPAQKVAAPWPTGDAAFDAELPRLRDQVRELAKPANPSKRVGRLTTGVKPGRLDEEIASCAPAVAQIKKVSEASPDQARATFVALADAIAACDCKPSIRRVKVLVYLMQRGPD